MHNNIFKTNVLSGLRLFLILMYPTYISRAVSRDLPSLHDKLAVPVRRGCGDGRQLHVVEVSVGLPLGELGESLNCSERILKKTYSYVF